MKRQRRFLVLAVLAGLSLPCTPARAQDGIIVDPDSAPAKEYALPLDAARQQASGEEPRREQEAAVTTTGAPPRPPAFGAGVESKQPSKKAKPEATRTPTPRPPKPKTPLELVAPSDRLVAVDDGGPAVAISVAAGLGVLLAGLAFAAGARRLRPRSG